MSQGQVAVDLPLTYVIQNLVFLPLLGGGPVLARGHSPRPLSRSNTHSRSPSYLTLVRRDNVVVHPKHIVRIVFTLDAR